MELWLTVTILYSAGGFLMLTANYRRLDDLRERRRVGALCFALVIFEIIIIHNFFTRNWTSWFGSVPPALFSGGTFVAQDVLFQFVPLTIANYVLTDRRRGEDKPGHSAAAKPTV